MERARPGLVIRPEDPSDADAIDRVVGLAFGGVVEPELVRLIRTSENYVPELSLVAELDGEVIGHVMLSHVALVDEEARHRVLSLSPLSVAPAVQRRGIGGALVRSALALAEENGEPLVLVEGDPRYYTRFGARDARSVGIRFDLPTWAPPNAGQVFVLSRYDPSLRGRVVYPRAFADAEAAREAPRA